MRFLQQKIKLGVAFIAIAGFSLLPVPAQAANNCALVAHAGASFTVCAFNPATSDIRTFWRDGQGQAYGGFSGLAEDIAAHGGKLSFAMNGGMYQADLSPVGLFVEKGQELHALNRRPGSGNFSLRPNGVFWVRQGVAGVTETQKFATLNPKPDYATQSGPMLVIGGKVHPKIHADGTSAKTRNGVGMCDDGQVRFAISEEPVTFFTFASLFRDKLKCPDALYLDGSVSSLYAPALQRADGWKPMGPIVGVVEWPNKK